MKVVSFEYQTELLFSSPASEHRFLLRILPRSDDRQRVRNFSWQIDPAGQTWRSSDGFGNEALSGHIDAPHDYFRFGIRGTAEISDSPYVTCAEPERALLYPTELTRAHEGLVNLYNDVKSAAPRPIDSSPNPIDLLRRVQYFSRVVHERMRYERGATTPVTSAREAFEAGVGVCQDYAHILLALLRLDGILCRYVAGLASDFGETHAWVEAWIADRFCGIDPTRDKLVDEGYLAISKGRDFGDCSIERGVFKGACRGTQTISLNMEVLQ